MYVQDASMMLGEFLTTRTEHIALGSVLMLGDINRFRISQYLRRVSRYT